MEVIAGARIIKRPRAWLPASTNDSKGESQMAEAIFTPATGGERNLMLGSVVCSTKLAGRATGDELAMIEVGCPRGTGPGPHTDPWRESFFVLEGEFEFQLERDGRLQPVTAGPGAAVSIPAGVGHAFKAVSAQARVLILSVPGGLDRFFAEAGEPIIGTAAPETQRPFDRPRFEAATDRFQVRRFVPAAAEA
jgi:quercetin dioxygenase-like cupin family protein